MLSAGNLCNPGLVSDYICWMLKYSKQKRSEKRAKLSYFNKLMLTLFDLVRWPRIIIFHLVISYATRRDKYLLSVEETKKNRTKI